MKYNKRNGKKNPRCLKNLVSVRQPFFSLHVYTELSVPKKNMLTKITFAFFFQNTKSNNHLQQKLFFSVEMVSPFMGHIQGMKLRIYTGWSHEEGRQNHLRRGRLDPLRRGVGGLILLRKVGRLDPSLKEASSPTQY